MAYKFQLGAARLSGSTTFEQALAIESTVSSSGDLSLGADLIMAGASTIYLAGDGNAAKIVSNGGNEVSVNGANLITNGAAILPDSDGGTNLGSPAKQFGTSFQSGLASLDGGINVNDDFTVDTDGGVTAVGINAGGAISGATTISGSGVVSAASFAADGDAVLGNVTFSTTGVEQSSAGGHLIIENTDADKAVRVILGANNTGFSGFQVRTSTGAQVFGATDQGVISGSGALSAASFAADGAAVLGGSLTAVGIAAGGALSGVTTLAASGLASVASISMDDGSTLGPDSVADLVTFAADGDITVKDGAYDFNIAAHDGTNGLMLGGVLVSASAADLNFTNVAAAGTAEASKALVVDASKNIAGINLLTASHISASTIQATDLTVSANSLIVGSTTITETEIAYLDGLTIGTAAASKALVLDASADITGINNLTASYFSGNGAGITNINVSNLDAVGSDTYVQFNQNGEFGAAAGFTFDGTGSVAVSGNLGSINYTKDWGGGAMATTESLGGKVTLGGYGNPYLQTRNIFVADAGGNLYNNFDIGHSGQIQLSSSMTAGAFDLAGLKFTNNPGDAVVSFEVNRMESVHNTSSIAAASMEYVWSVNSDHAGDDEDSAWLNLDLSSSVKNFKVGGRDNIQLIANAGLQVFEVANFDGNLLPNSDDAVDLGSSARQFKDLYIDGVAYIDDIDGVTADFSSTLNVDGLSTMAGITADGAIDLSNASVQFSADLDNAFDIAADAMYYRDATDSALKSRSWATVIGQIAGAGLTAASGQLSLSAVSTPTAFASTNVTLVEGLNYASGSAWDGAYTLTLPNSDDLDVGEFVKIKMAAGVSSGNSATVAIAVGSDDLIDGDASIVLESPYAAVNLYKVETNVWRIL